MPLESKWAFDNKNARRDEHSVVVMTGHPGRDPAGHAGEPFSVETTYARATMRGASGKRSPPNASTKCTAGLPLCSRAVIAYCSQLCSDLAAQGCASTYDVSCVASNPACVSGTCTYSAGAGGSCGEGTGVDAGTGGTSGAGTGGSGAGAGATSAGGSSGGGGPI